MRKDSTNPKRAWERATAAITAYVIGHGFDPSDTTLRLPPQPSYASTAQFNRATHYATRIGRELDNYRASILSEAPSALCPSPAPVTQRYHRSQWINRSQRRQVVGICPDTAFAA